MVALIALCVAALLMSAKENTTAQWQKYTVEKIRDSLEFATAPALMRIAGEAPQMKNWMGLLKMREWRNGKLVHIDTAESDGVPVLCLGSVAGDSLRIAAVKDYYSGIAVGCTIHKDEFYSHFGYFANEIKPFKQAPSDTAFTRSIDVGNREQKLVLYDLPGHNIGDIIEGRFTFRSNLYYERSGENGLDTVYAEGELRFRCTVLQNSTGQMQEKKGER